MEPSSQVSNEPQADQQNKPSTEVPVAAESSISSNDGRKVSREDIELVRNNQFIFWILIGTESKEDHYLLLVLEEIATHFSFHNPKCHTHF